MYNLKLHREFFKYTFTKLEKKENVSKLFVLKTLYPIIILKYFNTCKTTHCSKQKPCKCKAF